MLFGLLINVCSDVKVLTKEHNNFTKMILVSHVTNDVYL